MNPRISENAIAYPYPLRDQFTAQLLLPRDITKHEADRLIAFLHSLVIDEESESSEEERS
jgi:hypothetical protein